MQIQLKYTLTGFILCFFVASAMESCADEVEMDIALSSQVNMMCVNVMQNDGEHLVCTYDVLVSSIDQTSVTRPVSEDLDVPFKSFKPKGKHPPKTIVRM